MAEEVKKEEKKVDVNKIASMVFKVILGVAFLGLGAWAIIAWFEPLKIVFKGCVGLFLVLAGLITLAIAKE
ncbi:MAG: hypothetical protein WC335_03230 [Candidatus Omnitrophota bacterium]|jgi:fatty acid desaturase